MTTYNYKVWFTRKSSDQLRTMNVSRSEPMDVIDIKRFCSLDNKIYSTHVELPPQMDVELKVSFGSVNPERDMRDLLEHIQELESTIAQALGEALIDKLREFDIQEHIGATCDCYKIDLTNLHITRIVRSCSRMCDDEIVDLVSHINGMCEPNSETLILNYLHANLSYRYSEQEIEAKANELMEIISL